MKVECSSAPLAESAGATHQSDYGLIFCNHSVTKLITTSASTTTESTDRRYAPNSTRNIQNGVRSTLDAGYEDRGTAAAASIDVNWLLTDETPNLGPVHDLASESITDGITAWSTPTTVCLSTSASTRLPTRPTPVCGTSYVRTDDVRVEDDGF